MEEVGIIEDTHRSSDNPADRTPRRFTPSNIDDNALFIKFFENPNLSEIARESGIAYKTVLRISATGKWEERRNKILGGAVKKIDYSLEQATSQSLLMVRAAKNKLALRLQDLNPKHIATKDLISDIEKMIKLEQLLLGGMTDRKESVEMTHEERIRELRNQRISAAKDITPHTFREIEETTPRATGEATPREITGKREDTPSLPPSLPPSLVDAQENLAEGDLQDSVVPLVVDGAHIPEVIDK